MRAERRCFLGVCGRDFRRAPLARVGGGLRNSRNPSQLTGIASRNTGRASSLAGLPEKGHVSLTFTLRAAHRWSYLFPSGCDGPRTHAHTRTHIHTGQSFVSVSPAPHTCFSYFLPSAQAYRLGWPRAGLADINIRLPGQASRKTCGHRDHFRIIVRVRWSGRIAETMTS